MAVKWCINSLIWVKGTGSPLRWRICLNGKEIMISILLLPKNEKEKMKSQLLIFGIIQSPSVFEHLCFSAKFGQWNVAVTVTHKISMKGWRSQIFIYYDFSSLGNNRDLFGWLSNKKAFPSKHGYLLTLFFPEILVTLLNDNFLGKMLSFPPRFHLL